MNKLIKIKTLTKLTQILNNGTINLLPKTLINYFFAYQKTSISSNPIELQLELSSVCNLRCLMCNLDKSHDNIKFLTPSNLIKLINETKPLKSINLTGMGESLLNPHFEELVKILKKNQIPYTFISNGQLLDEKFTKILIKYPPTSISFSIESGIPKTYEKIRRGGTYNKFVQNISSFVKSVKLHQQNIEINFNIVFLDFNLNNIKHIFSIIKLASEIGIRTITTQLPYDYKSEKLEIFYKNNSKSIKEIFDQILVYANKLNIKISFPNSDIKKGGCYYPWIYPQITASGELLPCCVIPQSNLYSKVIAKYSFGNVFKTSFNSVWNNKKARDFRHSLKNNPCNDCKRCSKYQSIL